MQWNREGLVVLGGTNTEVFFFFHFMECSKCTVKWWPLLCTCGLSSGGLVYLLLLSWRQCGGSLLATTELHSCESTR